jgi:hypothetical protein
MLRQLGRLTTALVVFAALAMPRAHADWTITTYQGMPTITSMALADQYFTGALPQRFVAEGTVTHVNLYENGGNGQFADLAPFNPQFAFPGVDKNENGTDDTRDFTARISGTLRVAATVPAGTRYHFFTDSDDGNRFRIDLNQNGTFEDATESVVPDGGLQGSGDTSQGQPANFNANAEASTGKRNADPLLPGYYPDGIPLSPGDYAFEVGFFERGGGGAIDAGYQRVGNPLQLAIGDSRLGISLVAPAAIRVVGAATGPGELPNFAAGDALRTAPQGPGFPATLTSDVFNIHDSSGDADFPGGVEPPGIVGDSDIYMVVGTGFLQVPAGGISGAIFRSNSDDGGRLLIDTNRDGDLSDPEDVIINQDVPQGPTNTDSAPVSLAEGLYRLEYSFFEWGGGAEGEVSVNLGGQGFRLLGEQSSVAAGMSLDVLVPEPVSVVLLGMALAGLAASSRRRM